MSVAWNQPITPLAYFHYSQKQNLCSQLISLHLSNISADFSTALLLKMPSLSPIYFSNNGPNFLFCILWTQPMLIGPTTPLDLVIFHLILLVRFSCVFMYCLCNFFVPFTWWNFSFINIYWLLNLHVK